MLRRDSSPISILPIMRSENQAVSAVRETPCDRLSSSPWRTSTIGTSPPSCTPMRPTTSPESSVNGAGVTVIRIGKSWR